jgi:hypothetical protein
MYNNCNIYNIPIYFCYIRMKRMQHTSKISETLATCAFSATYPYYLGEWMLVGGRLAAASQQWRLHDWERAVTRHGVLQQRLGGAELAAPLEKVVAGPVKKAIAGHSSGEGRLEARWRESHDGEKGERESAVEREAQ